MQASDHAFDISTQVTLRVFGRFAAPAQYEEAYIVLFGECFFQVSVTLADIRRLYAGGRRRARAAG